MQLLQILSTVPVNHQKKIIIANITNANPMIYCCDVTYMIDVRLDKIIAA